MEAILRAAYCSLINTMSCNLTLIIAQLGNFHFDPSSFKMPISFDSVNRNLYNLVKLLHIFSELTVSKLEAADLIKL